MKNIFIFLMVACTLCFCSPSLYAQKKDQSTMKSLTHRNWIWQCGNNLFISIYFNKKTISFSFYGRPSRSFFNTRFPNEYKCDTSEVHPYYLSDSIPSCTAVFANEKVGNVKQGRYWVTQEGGIFMPSVMEIVKVTKDSLIVKDNRSENKILFKRIKKKEFNKLINKKHRIRKK
ncbi:hypothetical protein [Bacteroides nordii]|uniref:hypothetical protein n=1 Tax=Bacteroides nordii TaxID=291645 RepID=UPI00399B5029